MSLHAIQLSNSQYGVPTGVVAKGLRPRSLGEHHPRGKECLHVLPATLQYRLGSGPWSQGQPVQGNFWAHLM